MFLQQLETVGGNNHRKNAVTKREESEQIREIEVIATSLIIKRPLSIVENIYDTKEHYGFSDNWVKKLESLIKESDKFVNRDSGSRTLLKSVRDYINATKGGLFTPSVKKANRNALIVSQMNFLIDYINTSDHGEKEVVITGIKEKIKDMGDPEVGVTDVFGQQTME